MNEHEREFLHNALIAANRALLEYAIPYHDAGPSLKDTAIHDCLIAYGELLRCQMLPLSPIESTHVRGVLDRLKARLKYFGEHV